MRPILFSLRVGERGFAFPTYGALVAIGFVLGIVEFLRAGKRAGLDPRRLQDLAFYSVGFGLLGARLAFVLLNANAFLDACVRAGVPARLSIDARPAGGPSGCWAALRFWEGGLVFYGGAAAVAMVSLWFCRRERWSFLQIGDLAALPVAIGHALGRLGCLMAGCCYGKVCSAPWAVAFGPGSIAFEDHVSSGQIPGDALQTLPLHPTQLYEMAGELLIAAILWRWRRRWSGQGGEPARSLEGPHQPLGGQLAIYLVGYSTLRFVVELFRGDVERGFLVRWESAAVSAALGLPRHQPLLLSVSQFLSLVILMAVALAFVAGHRRRRAVHPTETTRAPPGPERRGPWPRSPPIRPRRPSR